MATENRQGDHLYDEYRSLVTRPQPFQVTPGLAGHRQDPCASRPGSRETLLVAVAPHHQTAALAALSLHPACCARRARRRHLGDASIPTALLPGLRTQSTARAGSRRHSRRSRHSTDRRAPARLAERRPTSSCDGDLAHLDDDARSEAWAPLRPRRLPAHRGAARRLRRPARGLLGLQHRWYRRQVSLRARPPPAYRAPGKPASAPLSAGFRPRWRHRPRHAAHATRDVIAMTCRLPCDALRDPCAATRALPQPPQAQPCCRPLSSSLRAGRGRPTGAP